jgi:hypothetical protein
VEIRPSARKHGVSDGDIEHAMSNYVYIANLEHGIPIPVLYLGPDLAGNLLEVVVLERDNDQDLVIHAMKMSRRYQALLPKRGRDR